MEIKKLTDTEKKALAFILEMFVDTHNEHRDIYPSEMKIAKKIIKIL